MKVCSIVVAVLFVAAARVQAAPLDLRQVPAVPNGLAHVDVDTMRGPEVFEKAYAAVTERWGRAGTALQSLRDEFGLDLAIGLHSVTLYGKQFGKPTGVLIANVDVDRGALEGKMKEASGYKTEPHGSHTLHSWADEHGPLTGVFYSSTVLVFGRSAADVAGAVDVLDGKSPNLAGKDSPLAAKVPAGADVCRPRRWVGRRRFALEVAAAEAERVRDHGVDRQRRYGRLRGPLGDQVGRSGAAAEGRDQWRDRHGHTPGRLRSGADKALRRP